MQLTKLLSCLLLVMLTAFSTLSNVYAATVQITLVQYPDTVSYGSSNLIHVRVSVTAGEFTTGNSNGQRGVLATFLLDKDHRDTTLYGADVIVTSEPDACHQVLQNGTGTALASDCRLLITRPIVSETIDFAFDSSHAPSSPLWHLEAEAVAFDMSGALTGATYNFTISVVLPVSTTSSQVTMQIQTTPVTTSATSPLQMPLVPQSTTSQPANTPQLALALAVIAAMVLGAVFLYRRRKKQPKAKQTTLRQFAKTPSSCIKCGVELPPASEFCNKCGTKQT